MTKVLGSFRGAVGLKRLREPKKGRALYKDAGTPGLYISISSVGRRAFECQMKVDGKPRWRTLGYFHEDDEAMSLEQARTTVKAARARLKAGLEPFPDTTDRRFPAAWERFEAQYMAKLAKRSAETYKTLRSRIGGMWEDREVASITADECRNFLHRIDELARQSKKYKTGKGAANSTYNALKFFFKWCWQGELLEVSPMSRLMPPYKTKELVRKHKLSKEDLLAIWDAAGEERHPLKQLVRFAMLVPGRIWSEVAVIRRRDVRNGIWTYTIPKTGAEQVLPLPRAALQLLEECQKREPCYFMPEKLHATAKTNLKKRLCERLPDDMEPWVFHDFRRAFLTHLRELGVPFDMADEIQRPNPYTGTTGGKHYDMSQRPEDKGEVLSFWAYVLGCWRHDREPKRWRDYLRGADVVRLEAVS